jgi:ABC-type branched-subunit amino acid transport system ATPase component
LPTLNQFSRQHIRSHRAFCTRAIATIRRVGETGVTVVLIEHVMPAIMSLADIVTVLDQGRVLATGTPEEITSNPAVIAAYLGDEVAA